MARVWLNVDLGELPDEPPELYACANVVNVACGGHAGDAESMRQAIDLCAAHGAKLGAHPSYPDRKGFGRMRVAIPPDELQRCLGEQCAHLQGFARAAGVAIAFVKPHGALYHVARTDEATAEAIVVGAQQVLGMVTIIGPPDGALARAAARAKLGYAREGFADRATREDGTLVPRSEPGALLLDPSVAAARARSLAAAGEVDTVCVHGDTPGAVAIAGAVRTALDSLVRAER